MPTILTIAFLVLLALGVPIAFSIALGSVVAIIVDGRLPLTLVPQRTIAGADAFSLLAVPMFILVGNLMNIGGVTDKIINLANALVGRFRGGLAQSSIVSAVIFSGVSGSAVSEAAALGKILVPAMKKQGYSGAFSAAVVSAACINGPIMPPSVPLIVYAVSVGVAGVTVEKMFMAGIVPSIVYSLGLILVTYMLARRNNFPVSMAVPLSRFPAILVAALPAVFMFIFIRISVSLGIATVTESAAVAVGLALLIGVAYGNLNLRNLPNIFMQSALETAIVLIIVATSAVFAWLATVSGFARIGADLILAISDNPAVVIFMIVLFLLALGTFMDGLPAMLILIPVLLPVAQQIGMDLTQFGMVLVFGLMLGLLTPPVGLLLFITGAFAGVTMGQQFRAILPYLAVGAITLTLIAFIPGLSLWLPQWLGM
ncbi:TRAP transporter large permease [Shinella sp. S4-D37]|uniref:TRAP transporter large permease n=1 Tax=Shinella sp. S4-D37 TaxID=3161999 RepID=UPI003466EAF5